MSLDVGKQKKDIVNNFIAAYKTFQNASESGGSISFTSNDADYSVDGVDVSVKSEKSTPDVPSVYYFDMKLRHKRGGALEGDDIATIRLSYDPTGELTDVEGDIQMGSDFLKKLVVGLGIAVVLLAGTVLLVTGVGEIVDAVGAAGLVAVEGAVELTEDLAETTAVLANTSEVIDGIVGEDTDMWILMNRACSKWLAADPTLTKVPLSSVSNSFGYEISEAGYAAGYWLSDANAQALSEAMLQDVQARGLDEVMQSLAESGVDVRNDKPYKNPYSAEAKQSKKEAQPAQAKPSAKQAKTTTTAKKSTTQTKSSSSSSSKTAFNAPDYCTVGALTSAANVLTQWATQIESGGDDTDSGRINFSAVIMHAIFRAQFAFLQSRKDLYSQGKAVHFSANDCSSAAQQTAKSNKDISNLKSAKSGKALEFNYKDQAYRMWIPDVSGSFGGSCIMLSTKIDLDNGGKDDHVLLLVVYNTKSRKLVMGHATLAIRGDSNLNVGPVVFDDTPKPAMVALAGDRETFRASPGSSIESALPAEIKNRMQQSKQWDSWGKQQHNTNEVVALVINWIANGL